MGGFPPRQSEVFRAGDQHPGPAREGTSNGFGSFPTHDQVVSHRQGFEVFSLLNTRLSTLNPGTMGEARVIFVAKRIK